MFPLIVQRYRQAFSDLPANVWLMSAILLVNRSGTMMLPFLGLYLTDKLEMPETQFGVLLSLYGVGGITGAYLGGRFSRQLGSITTMVTCMLLSVPFYLLVGFTTTPIGLMVILPIMALPVEAARPATTSATTDLCPKHLHTKALALNRMAINLGMAIGPVIGGAVYHFGFLYLVAINAAMTLLAAGFFLIAFRKAETRQPTANPSPSIGLRPHDSPWRDPIYLTLLLINIVTGLIFFQIMGTFSIYLRDDFQWTEYQLGLLLAINTVVIVLVEMVLVDYVKQFSYLRVIGWGCLAVGTGFGMIAISGTLWFAIGSVLIWTVGEMLTMPLSVAFASHRSTDNSRSAYLAAYSMSFSICMIFAPIIGTQLYQANHALPWWIALLLGPLLLVASYGLARWEERESNSSPPDSHPLQVPESAATEESSATPALAPANPATRSAVAASG